MDCEPLMALLPDQAPEAVQEVALVDDQVNVEAPPLVIVLGLAPKATVGTGGVTETVVDCVALPPAPVQVRVYVALDVRAPVDCEPLTAFVPDQPPEAVHVVAFVADQDNVDAPPLAIVLGLAPSLTVAVGVGLTVTVTD